VSRPPFNFPAGCMGLPLELIHPPCCAGIDVRPGNWSVVISDRVAGSGIVKNVLRVIFHGDLRDETEVLWILRQYRCCFAVVDTRPETTLALRLQDAAEMIGIEIWRAEYLTTPSRIKITRNEKERLVRLARTVSLDAAHHHFQTGQSVVIPQNFREMNRGKFESELTSSTRVFTRWQGQDDYEWVHKGDDHTLHAFNLLLIAYEMSGLGNWHGAASAERGLVESSLDRNLRYRGRVCPFCGKDFDDLNAHVEQVHPKYAVGIATRIPWGKEEESGVFLEA
jgi:hypothetical protein